MKTTGLRSGILFMIFTQLEVMLLFHAYL